MSGFWVLEDLRCEKWSPTPQYLHADAGFYSHNGNWYGEIGGGGHLQTPEIHKARRFPSQEEAESFRMTHGADCGMNTRLWASREHAFVAPAQDLGVAVADTSAERGETAADGPWLLNLGQYAALGVACERNGLAGYGPDGQMWFQPPADVIAEHAAEEALRASAHPLPTTASAVEEGKITEGEKEKPLFCRDDEDPVAFRALVDAAARQSDRELAQEAASREAGLREALEAAEYALERGGLSDGLSIVRQAPSSVQRESGE